MTIEEFSKSIYCPIMIADIPISGLPMIADIQINALRAISVVCRECDLINKNLSNKNERLKDKVIHWSKWLIKNNLINKDFLINTNILSIYYK